MVTWLTILITGHTSRHHSAKRRDDSGQSDHEGGSRKRGERGRRGRLGAFVALVA